LCSAGELENQLQKSDTYKQISTYIDSNEAAKKEAAKVQQYLNEKTTATERANREAKLIYEDNINASPCSHCPKYLNLTQAVNKIVEKVKSDASASESNQSLIELNKLKFLYYVVRSENDDGAVGCKKYVESYVDNPGKLEGNFKLLSETLMNMSEVTDLQYHQRGKDEVYYYYRGEGDKSNIIIEVKMNKDGSSRMRYYEYAESDRSPLPDLGQSDSTAEAKGHPKKDNYLDVNFDLQTKNALPTDIQFAKAGLSTKVTEDMNLKMENEINFNQQKTSVALEDNKGSKWLVLEGKNVTMGEKSVNAVIPMEIKLDESSEMKVNGSLEKKVTVKEMDHSKKETVDSEQKVTLGLTDHNNEYIKVKAVVNDSGTSSYSVSNKLALGKNSSVGAVYEQTRDGKKTFSINNVANFDNYGKLTTSFGTTSDNKEFVQTQYENKISDRTSIVIDAKVSDQTTVSLIYQAKF
ncbi:MAG: hypothetical protein ACXVCE_07115, partial [Bacteriovorax sp.]